MIGVDRTRAIFEGAYKQAGGQDDVQLILHGGKEQLARIGKNEVYQNILNKEYTIRGMVAQGNRVGLSSCNRFDENSVQNAVKVASDIAAIQKEDPDYRGLYADSEAIVDERFYHQPTMDAAFDTKLNELQGIFADSRSKNVEVAGAFSHGDGIYAIGNSKGLFRYHIHTDASFTLSIMTPAGGTGWAEFHSHRLEDIQPSILYRIALEKALASENPISIEPGEFTVILEPPAVQSLMFWLGYLGFGGLPCQEGRSFLSGKEGEKVFGDNISLEDNHNDVQSYGCPFDSEGMRKQSLTLVERGVFIQPTLDRNVSIKRGGDRVSTGHALPYPSSVGPLPLNMSMKAGDKSLDEMVQSTQKGILVTRFFYDNVIDPQKLTITGMTRDGTFLVENGKIVKGLKNMRYNISLPHILNQVREISSQKWSLREFGRMSLPALKIDGFRFTGSST